MSGVLVNPYFLTTPGAVDVIGALGLIHTAGLAGSIDVPSSLVFLGETDAFPVTNTAVNVTLPGGCVVGTLCVCVAIADLTFTATPAGFSPLDFNNANVQTELRSSTKVLDSTDISNGFVTVPGDPNFNGIPYQFWFFNGHAGIDVSATFQGLSAATDAVETIPAVTSTANGGMIVHAVGGRDSGDSWTGLPAGYTTDRSFAGSYYSMYAGHKLQATAGDTGVQTATNVNTVSTQYASTTIVIKAGTAGGGVPVDAIGSLGSFHTAGIGGLVDIPGGGGGAGITILGTAAAFPQTSASVNVPLPSGSALGNLVSVAAIGDVGATASLGVTWANVLLTSGGVVELRRSSKFLDATDMANGFITLPGDPGWNGIRYAVWFMSGTDGGDGAGVITAGTDSSGADSTLTVADITTSVPQDLILVVGGGRGSGVTWVTPPSGGLVTDQDNPGGYISMFAGHYVKPTPGSTGAQFLVNTNAPYQRWVTSITPVRPG